MLSVGSALLGAAHVVGLEIDCDALEVATANVQQFTDPPLPVRPDTGGSTAGRMHCSNSLHRIGW
jgi:hypothetical protein